VDVELELELERTEDRREVRWEQSSKGTEEESFVPEKKRLVRHMRCLCVH
jgi:hypothetical protein